MEAKSLDGFDAYDWTFNFLIGNDGSDSMQGMVVTRDISSSPACSRFSALFC